MKHYVKTLTFDVCLNKIICHNLQADEDVKMLNASSFTSLKI
jgi:hypothetical protein